MAETTVAWKVQMTVASMAVVMVETTVAWKVATMVARMVASSVEMMVDPTVDQTVDPTVVPTVALKVDWLATMSETSSWDRSIPSGTEDSTMKQTRPRWGSRISIP